MTVLFGLMAATIQRQSEDIRDLQLFRAATNGNRFTEQEARQMYRDIIDYHEENTPPEEVEFQLNNLNERVTRLERGN